MLTSGRPTSDKALDELTYLLASNGLIRMCGHGNKFLLRPNFLAGRTSASIPEQHKILARWHLNFSMVKQINRHSSVFLSVAKFLSDRSLRKMQNCSGIVTNTCTFGRRQPQILSIRTGQASMDKRLKSFIFRRDQVLFYFLIMLIFELFWFPKNHIDRCLLSIDFDRLISPQITPPMVRHAAAWCRWYTPHGADGPPRPPSLAFAHPAGLSPRLNSRISAAAALPGQVWGRFWQPRYARVRPAAK
jgi:hypothetical protein